MARAAYVDPCAPAPPSRCRTVTPPLFKAGISVRHAPLCDGNVCLLDYCGSGNWRVASSGTLDRSRWIEGWIYTQLTNRGEVQCEEHPLKERAGGWWADAFRPAGSNFKTGSKLWALQWARVDNTLLVAAKAAAEDAIRPLISWGIASSIKVEAVYISSSTVHLRIAVRGPGVAVNAVIQGAAAPHMGYMWTDYQQPARAA